MHSTRIFLALAVVGFASPLATQDFQQRRTMSLSDDQKSRREQMDIYSAEGNAG